ARLEAMSSRFELSGETAPAGGKLALSRFAYVRRDGRRLVLESPDASCRVILETTTAAESFARVALGGDQNDDELMRDLLSRAGFLEPEEETGALATWEFHDRLFHARTRGGFDRAPTGAPYRL